MEHPVLREHQERAVRETPDKYGLWFKMRVGKTATAIRLASTRASRALVIVPKSLKYQWNKEIEKWKTGSCEFHVISKEDMRLGKNVPKNCDCVIPDEAHLAFANFKSKTYKALYAYIQQYNVKYIWPLTGSPYTSSSWSIFSYGHLLGKDWKWFEWNKRYFYQLRMGRRIIPKAKPGMDKELQDTLREIGTVIDLKDIADVPDDEDVVETFALNTEQKQAIKKHFDPLPIVRWHRQHQIESGSLKGDEYNETEYYDCLKDSRIIEIAESTPKLILVCAYLAQIYKYQQILISKFPEKHVLVISGQEKKSASEIAAETKGYDNCVVIIQADTVNGYDLQDFDTVVFASMSYSFVNYDQLRSRSKNMDKKIRCTYIHLITEGKSIDRAVYDCIQRKQDFSFELYNGK